MRDTYLLSFTSEASGRRAARIANNLVGGGLLLSLGSIALAIAMGLVMFGWFSAHPRLVRVLEPRIAASLVLLAAGLSLLLRLLGGSVPVWHASHPSEAKSPTALAIVARKIK